MVLLSLGIGIWMNDGACNVFWFGVMVNPRRKESVIISYIKKKHTRDDRWRILKDCDKGVNPKHLGRGKNKNAIFMPLLVIVYIVEVMLIIPTNQT